MEQKKQKVINYLKEWGSYMSLAAIEREVGMKPTTLRPFLNGKKYNIDPFIDKLHELFEEMAFCY